MGPIRERLLVWYESQRRDLPWRRTRDPYAIWVSEVMLQQTQVKTVLGYYERWMQRFPTVTALAAAAEADVLHAWQGLGYYSRARRLLEGARAVSERHAGKLPRDVSALLELPGIGPYSAGAIASIAFGLPEPIVDGNVVRVLCRLFALRGDPAKAPLKPQLWQLARALVPAERAGELNQSLMELGATLCTPTSPRCPECPVRGQCSGLEQGVERDLPELAKRKPPTAVQTAAAYVREGERVLLRQMPARAPRWAGLWVLPFVELGAGETPLVGAERALFELGSKGSARALLREARHTITRFRITLHVVGCELDERSTLASGVGLFSPLQIKKLALPSVHSRVLRALEPPTAE
ncbi:MAG TPA: A/G-specific adenine glycosylase [Polyangiaceae bacterium]|nr:A/G-specific adenine glycosylase [Polyangiaceae bacterium]